MGKKVKIIFLAIIVVLLLAGGGVFYWQNQADVAELNKTLPAGVRVEKSLLGSEYRVVNNIDGYEFKVPPEWGGISEIEYIPEREEVGFRGTSINIKGLNQGKGLGIDRFSVDNDSNLLDWTKNMFKVVGLIGEFASETIGSFEIIKTQENIHLAGMYMYFTKKESSIYSFTSGSEDFIRYIITNGKW